MTTRIGALCRARGITLTSQRRLITRVISEARGHPDFAEFYRRVVERNPRVSRATVYKTLKLLANEGIIECHAFRDGRLRYERISGEHHDHLIDLKTGKVCDFSDSRIERLQEHIARQLGYKLVDHRLELYATPLSRADARSTKDDRDCKRR